MIISKNKILRRDEKLRDILTWAQEINVPFELAKTSFPSSYEMDQIHLHWNVDLSGDVVMLAKGNRQ